MRPTFTNKTFGEQVIEFHQNLKVPDHLPVGVEWINNLDQEETQRCITEFFSRYFSDHRKRLFLFGINPGRFGAGLTGVGFTDPVYLEERCGISNLFDKRHELSSHFIYRVIDAYGSVERFYKHHFITSLLPLGLLKDGKNYNYYDDPQTLSALEPFVIESINKQIEFGTLEDRAICIGKGTNYRYFTKLNKQQGWFSKITPVPHPRWVMQYNRKDIDLYVEKYLSVLMDA
ncbi:DUF4918 family protein [Membranicola marinus]|uniref:DUF4918 family protein n=1 Tax=Membranihabitans marinus TaxID=1227546 RepID=A0A953HLG0_9BACT|nr:uracil-DNA glycosylase family protein [Membranihabitans marinus]MBY5957259.1 DUF4918 family protein [Membranihabitans marinus]